MLMTSRPGSPRMLQRRDSSLSPPAPYLGSRRASQTALDIGVMPSKRSRSLVQLNPADMAAARGEISAPPLTYAGPSGALHRSDSGGSVFFPEGPSSRPSVVQQPRAPGVPALPQQSQSQPATPAARDRTSPWSSGGSPHDDAAASMGCNSPLDAVAEADESRRDSLGLGLDDHDACIAQGRHGGQRSSSPRLSALGLGDVLEDMQGSPHSSSSFGPLTTGDDRDLDGLGLDFGGFQEVDAGDTHGPGGQHMDLFDFQLGELDEEDFRALEKLV